MHCRIPLFIRCPFDMLINRTRTAFYVHTFRIDFVNLIHALGVKYNTATNGKRAALRACAAPPSRHGDFVIICYFQHLRRFLRVLGCNDKVCLGHSYTAVHPHSRKPKKVCTMRNLINFFYRTIFSAYRIFQLGQNLRK